MAIGLMGLGLTVLGIVLAYIWKSNGKLQRAMMSALERIEKGQEGMMKGQEGMMSALERIGKGQEKGFEVIAEMLLNQTKILERIEGKIS